MVLCHEVDTKRERLAVVAAPVQGDAPGVL
jgi:hypothetical protein